MFLAFPAIFPASATLLEKHEKQKKQRKGLNGAKRERLVAGVDAAGRYGVRGSSSICIGVWKLLPGHSGWAVPAGATLAWVTVAVSVWVACEKLRQL